jgi:hypothetical protein
VSLKAEYSTFVVLDGRAIRARWQANSGAYEKQNNSHAERELKIENANG